jgi:hypothetical protein
MNFRRHRIVALGAVMAIGFCAPIKADITSVYQAKNIEHNQTGPSTVSVFGTFFSGAAFMPAAGDYNTGTLTYPGPGSPQTLSPGTFGGPNVGFQTPYFPNQASLDAAYPFGLYTYHAMNTVTLASSSNVGISYTADAYSTAVPTLTSGSFNALQGYNSSQSLTVNFNSFAPAANASVGYLFWGFFNRNTNNTDLSQGFLSPSTNSLFIPGGTLAPNTDYSLELNFDDRIFGRDVNGSGIGTTLGFDERTFLNFKTAAAVPEPTSFAIRARGNRVVSIPVQTASEEAVQVT